MLPRAMLPPRDAFLARYDLFRMLLFKMLRAAFAAADAAMMRDKIR